MGGSNLFPFVLFLFLPSGGSKHFLTSPGGLLMGEGSSNGNSGPRTPAGDALPLVSVPTSAGSGAAANARCLVWHPDDEVLVPLAESPGTGGSASVSPPRSASGGGRLQEAFRFVQQHGLKKSALVLYVA